MATYVFAKCRCNCSEAVPVQPRTWYQWIPSFLGFRLHVCTHCLQGRMSWCRIMLPLWL